jgi:retinol-binding protein 3
VLSPVRLPALLCASLLAATRAAAQESAAGPVDRAVRQAVVDTIAAQLERFYVDADTGRLIAARLRERLAAGAYDRMTTTVAFAEALTGDLRSVNGDLHLNVRYGPDLPTEHPGSRGLTTPRPRPPGAPPDPQELEPTPGLLAEWRQANFGLERAARLEGNVGYIEVRGFYDVPEAFAATGAALAFLERTDAMIFDLRDMPGGSGDMSNWLLSHFTGNDSVASLAITNRSAGDSVVRYTMPKVPGTRRPDVPLFVLTSRGTASAGEDFTFVLHNLRRATLVGEQTAGAGHNNAFLASGHGFVLSVSYTRVMDPRTGKEWERVGVEPDVPVAPERALETAHALALRAIAARTTDPGRQRELALTAETLEAQARPHRVPQPLLARYAGTYGERSLTLRGDTLLFRRLQYPPRALVPLNDSTFALATVERVTIEGGRGSAPRLRLVRQNGDTVRAGRTGPPPRPAR